MDTVGKRKAVKRKTNADDNYWLPFHENTIKFGDETLIPYFTKPCLAAGFNLMAKGWEEKHQFLHFVCNRSRAANSKQKEDPDIQHQASSKKKKAVRRTCRPIRGKTTLASSISNFGGVKTKSSGTYPKNRLDATSTMVTHTESHMSVECMPKIMGKMP